MKCPCKKADLVPARTNEHNPAIDGLKCPSCGNLYRTNDSNHLVLLDPNLSPLEVKGEEKFFKLTPASRMGVKSTHRKKEPSRKLTEKDKATIRSKVAAGVDTAVICKELNCKTWQVYYYGKPKKESLATRVVRTREEAFEEKPAPPSLLLIQKASNGFVVTDANAISIYCNTAALLVHVKNWAGA
jgi:uncharacterized protein YbaR (Trm112 family)